MATPTDTSKEVEKAPKPEFFKVVLTHPDHHKRVVFRSISEARARSFVERRYPRGSEAHLVAPDGTIEHYEHERQDGEYGLDADRWAEFDPSTWEPTNQAAPPGESEWADREG